MKVSVVRVSVLPLPPSLSVPAPFPADTHCIRILHFLPYLFYAHINICYFPLFKQMVTYYIYMQCSVLCLSLTQHIHIYLYM